jgi:Zn-dependent peptidase ImmA (M78 family)
MCIFVMMKTLATVNADMLTCAIKRAGFDVHDFATKYPKVLSWIDDTKKPTIKQLEDFSHRVHLPFGYLFLDSPPKEKLPIPFFRTGNTPATSVSLNVFDTILLIQRRQEWLVEYLNENGFEKPAFIGKFQGKTKYRDIVADIRNTLDLKADWASSFQTTDKALDYLTQKIEEAGIIVTFNSVVENNNRRPIPVEECRGFVLVDPIAPFMFVNAADGKAAQLFTILHELAHIWTGRSAGFDFRQMHPASDPIEQLCDHVAAEFLVPENSFHAAWLEHPDIAQLVKRFKVSYIVIARRALDLGKITKSDFFKLYNTYVKKLKDKKEKQSGGGDFYATQKKRLSLRFTAHINQALKEHKLLYRDAYKMTGLKGDTFQNFVNKNL